jgi:hypothetical protein
LLAGAQSGGGGVLVNDAERAALRELATTLGVDPPAV